MNAQELIERSNIIATRYVALLDMTEELPVASSDNLSIDHASDALAEAIFLRAFTAYENDVETMFLHYVTGGATLQGALANTYLRITDTSLARKLTKAGFKFLNWAKPQDIKVTAETYIENGWPLVDMMATKTQDLSDCERIRNRIAHSSPEAVMQFDIVQRNMLATERLFPITPGQFLRIRSTRLRTTNLAHYINIMNDTLIAILDPPP